MAPGHRGSRFEDMLPGERMTRLQGCVPRSSRRSPRWHGDFAPRPGGLADHRGDRLPGALRLDRRSPDAERGRARQVVALVVEVSAGRVPVMAGATSNDTARAVDETRRMCRLGADYILSATPTTTSPPRTVSTATSRWWPTPDKPVCSTTCPAAPSSTSDPRWRYGCRAPQHRHQGSERRFRQIMEIIRRRPARFAVLWR
jgi:hypothetical protein